MKSAPIKRYYLGLSIIGIFTIVVFSIVLFKAIGGRQDVATAAKASQIADKLNTYTGDNSKVPSSLSEVGIKEVPNTITYKMLSSTSYTFCATYQSADSSSAVNGVASGISQLESGARGTTIDPSLSSTPTSSDNSYLDVSTHHKGQNCQTITIYNSQSYPSTPVNNNGGSSSSGSGTSDQCPYPTNDNSNAAYQTYLDCINKSYNNSNNSTTQATPTTKT
jgi:hypothetical protein